MFDSAMNIQFVRGVGEKRAKLFNKLGIHTVGDLLRLFPRDYFDFGSTTTIANAPIGENCCIKAVVGHEPVATKIRTGMTLFKTVVTDGINLLGITIFNNKYLAASLKTGQEYCFFGKVTYNLGKAEMSSPLVAEASGAPAFLPVYPLTAGLTSKGISNVMRNALTLYRSSYVPDTLSEEIRNTYKLCSNTYAYSNIHFPTTRNDIESAKHRLIFEELLVLQLGMFRLKRSGKGTTTFIIHEDNSEEFFDNLPFTMTGAQKRAVKECLNDMKSNVPMNRLLQGDVGSGKTAVAAAIIHSATNNGMQCAMMAPTEILAHQHYETMLTFFENSDTRVSLLCGSTTAANKRKIKTALRNGEIDLIIGTHALLQGDVDFQSLGLIVTDEQHRFGVKQRSTLSDKGNNPHTLVMSATPIPRTLALIVYGDLDISVLDEMPAGRQPVATYCIDSSYHKRVYSFIKKHLDMGLQAYIVCPAVEQNEFDLTSAAEYKQQLEGTEFSSYRVGLLHGHMKNTEKEKAMDAFCKGETQLLVCTTVVEVGVDVPNAAVMLIENAERFGLSQLHQLRGRVGRGKAKSTCILCTDSHSEETEKRMQVLCKTNDGFRIADEDLRLRGPGDFFGARQHGLPEIHIADTLDDIATLNLAQQAAKELMNDDPFLQKSDNRLLAKAVERLFSESGINPN